MRTIKLLSTKPSRWLALGLAALASACAGITSTYSPNISTFYTPGVVRYAVQGGAMPLVVRGVALEGQSSEASASMAAANMRLPRWFQSVPFQAPPVEGAPSGNYRTVLLFNPVALSTSYLTVSAGVPAGTTTTSHPASSRQRKILYLMP